ncbi:unnamed protein product, partial [Allacma fusca]
ETLYAKNINGGIFFRTLAQDNGFIFVASNEASIATARKGNANDFGVEFRESTDSNTKAMIVAASYFMSGNKSISERCIFLLVVVVVLLLITASIGLRS